MKNGQEIGNSYECVLDNLLNGNFFKYSIIFQKEVKMKKIILTISAFLTVTSFVHAAEYKLIFSCSIFGTPAPIIQCFNSYNGVEASLKVKTQTGSKTYKTRDPEILHAPNNNLEIEINESFTVQFRASSEKSLLTTMRVFEVETYGNENLIHEDQAKKFGRILYRSP